MENQIREVIQHSQDLNLDLPYIDEWVKDWKKAKEVVLYKMGGNPICELPDEMAFPMTSDIRDQKFDDFIISKYNVYTHFDILLAKVLGYDVELLN